MKCLPLVLILFVFLKEIRAESQFVMDDGLELTLSASEPEILSLSNIDVDHKGRVWACEVINYGPNKGKRKEGDRILIMEDKDGDGKMDEVKTFYQGNDVNAAMGLCVLSDRVIVSVTPNVWVFFDDDGDDRADRKELLFTGDGAECHDHSYHSLVFGPDGKMYWNFGNTGKNLKNKSGDILKDLHGRNVEDKGKPFWGGMVFRSDLDGGGIEILGHNFRNNYEVTVDSFGSLWQSDNDDDGNRATRINFILEGGNYGYLDELTGEGWRKERAGMHRDVSLKHWHLNDPGVVPNVLQTGAGAPTGITVYEGKLLPKRYRNQLIHCESGVNVVRAYPIKDDGAGYKADSIEVMKSVDDRSFRPIDVAVAPDGSLFISDWYDPVVGGFQQRDIARGRLYRIAPKGSKYINPKLGFETALKASEALKNPNYCVRYEAWKKLHKMGNAAEDALLKLYHSSDSRIKARALWLLGKCKGREQFYVNMALKDEDPDIRIIAIRLARQTNVPIIEVLQKISKDPSPKVRRECAISLTHIHGKNKARLWASLAELHQVGDRWSLEALGIGASDDWDDCLSAWLEKIQNNWDTPQGREIIWRSRAKESATLIAKIIKSKETPEKERPKYFRALDFQSASQRDKALLEILQENL